MASLEAISMLPPLAQLPLTLVLAFNSLLLSSYYHQQHPFCLHLSPCTNLKHYHSQLTQDLQQQYVGPQLQYQQHQKHMHSTCSFLQSIQISIHQDFAQLQDYIRQFKHQYSQFETYQQYPSYAQGYTSSNQTLANL